MKAPNYNEKLQNYFVHLHDNEWLDKQRVAGKCWREVFSLLKEFIKTQKDFTLKDLDNFGGKEIRKRDCYPTFLGYKGFPNNLCLSVNKELVHGIGGSYKPQEGDLLTIDFGTSFKGDGKRYAIADAASTIAIGTLKAEHTRLIEATRECLTNAIKIIKPGIRLGSIGYVIDRTAKKHGFNVVTTLGGHGLDFDRPHAFVFIPNKSVQDEGLHIAPGLTLAIEPLLVPSNCSTKHKVEADNWTITTDEIGAHEEATIFVHQDHTEVIAGPEYLS